MKRRYGFGILTACTAAMFFVFAGCSGEKPAEESGTETGGSKRYQIGFAMTLDHPYWHNMRLGAEDEAAKRGADITILNAKEDPSIQNRQIRELIAKKVDIVCLVPMKKEPLVPGIQALNRANIPVIVVNREVGEGCDYVCYVGTDTYGGAVTSARILMEAIGGEGEIVEFHMQLGTGPEILRSKALQDVLKGYPNVQQVERLPTRGEESVVVASMRTVLDKYPNLKGVYTHTTTLTP